ncbi:MAG TPA: hydroxyisourate hydrolase [Acidobacteriaceae bacterium]|nr:hydroxyisourate hydrolase [Acidobacteriaceae bacterium]
MNGLSTHVLDTGLGKPVVALGVHLEIAAESGVWRLLASQKTDADGRCRQLLPLGEQQVAGRYRLRFETGSYFEGQSLEGLYPVVEITFLVRESDTHLHIPLLLTANGYTTYRGT